MTVILSSVLFNLSHKFFHAFECASSYCSLGDEVEPDLNLVEPGGIGRCVVYMPSVMNRQPALDFGMFMGGIVVDHQMNI